MLSIPGALLLPTSFRVLIDKCSPSPPIQFGGFYLYFNYLQFVCLATGRRSPAEGRLPSTDSSGAVGSVGDGADVRRPRAGGRGRRRRPRPCGASHAGPAAITGGRHVDAPATSQSTRRATSRHHQSGARGMSLSASPPPSILTSSKTIKELLSSACLTTEKKNWSTSPKTQY